MLTVAEIKEVKFDRAIGGYKPDDVDVFLDKIEADYAAFERIIKEYELKVETLNSEIEGFKNSQSSIQSVLVSAQRLADQIVNEAKERSQEIIKQAENNIISITAREKELSSAFELKAQEQKSTLEKELAEMIKSAQEKAEVITAGAEERVKHQQMLFDRLKLEISAFKTGISAKYKEHIEMLSKLPDSVPADPAYIAEALAASFDKIREESKQPELEEAIVTETVKTTEEEPKGFVVEEISDETEEEDI